MELTRGSESDKKDVEELFKEENHIMITERELFLVTIPDFAGVVNGEWWWVKGENNQRRNQVYRQCMVSIKNGKKYQEWWMDGTRFRHLHPFLCTIAFHSLYHLLTCEFLTC